MSLPCGSFASEALESFDKAIEINANFADAYSNRGVILQEMRRYDEALQSYDNAIKIKDYVKLIADKLNWNGHVNWNTKPKRPGEIYLLNSTNHKITTRLGWFPKVELSDGLDKTIAVWKDIIENEKPHNLRKNFSRGK